MKTRLLLLVPILGTAAEVPVTLPTAAADVELRRDETGMTLGVRDPANQTWMLRSSTDFQHWSDGPVLRVHNGRLDISITPDGPARFYQLASRAPVEGAATATATLDLPETPFNYANPTLPAHLRAPVIRAQDNTPVDNPVTDAGATLGRVLFYDNRLSANQTVSCASCHQAEHGFSDPARFSTGFDGGLTGRNSMGLTNARYYARGHFFWDERAATLEDQTLEPIQNAVEMGMTLDVLTSRIENEPYYAELFTDAFGDETITTDRISKALAQFVRSIVSGNSKYDQGVPLGFSNFNAQEQQGRQIFTGPAGGCAACHGSDNFVPGAAIFNNGLENPYIDKGLGEVTGLAADEGFFKVPSLRNIELTAPYMHDGRFATLEEVVDFYNNGVVNHPNLSPQLRLPPGPPGSPPPGPRRLNLTNDQKAALVAFLKTLTDTSVTTDPKFSDPFRYHAE
ncbi:MAG: c-type cytochrome [Akkermansiaceae bacterium]|nr:c-type cytochrome [Akkermansiaceae bacterium]MCP5544249.1 c-type cytochrome [Akkermansiaceae bacterium]MCP5547027.1 c-type cytochrome [Akkermansiaceae bacterium]